MKPEAPHDYRSGFQTEAEARMLKTLLDHLAENGILMIATGSGTLSTPMTEKEIDRLGEAMLGGFRKCLSVRYPG
jgi:glutamate-1-semialdehyde 2,1-aminomutase